MALYEITAPDGSVYEIEGPEGATDKQLVSALLQQRRNTERQERLRRIQEARFRPAAEAEPETTVMGNVGEFFKGLAPGAVGLVESAALGASSLLDEDTERSAREKIKEIAGVAKKPFEAEAGYEESMGRKFGEALGSTVPFFALGPLGIAGRVGAGALGSAAGAGEASERAIAGGATEEQKAAATGLGTLIGATEILPVFKFIDSLGKPLTDGIMSRLRRAAATGGAEGLQEASAQIAQNLVEKGIYNPEAGVFTGSGEALGYGAGVGGLIQALTDMALGRRQARARRAEDERKAAETAAEEARVAPAAPTAERPQGELFPVELTEAQAAVAAQAGPPAPEAPEFELAAQERDLQAERQMELPLEMAPEAPARDERQPDLIDLLETEQIQEMERAERIAPTVGAMNEAELARVQARRAEQEAKKAEEAEKERLKFESDLAELDGRIKAKEEKTAQDERLEVLLPIIETPEIKNIPKTFISRLEQMGYAAPKLTDRERNLINRAYDIRLVEEVEPEVAPSAPAEISEMEAAIPERKEGREPQQLGIPGIGQRRAPEVTEEAAPEEAAAFATVLTPEVLDKTGLPRQSGFYRQLLNKDMADPGQQQLIADVFAQVRTNPNIKPRTKEAIETIAMQAFGGLAQQQELFGPRGGVKGAKKDVKPDRAKPTGTGVGSESDVGVGGLGRVEPSAGGTETTVAPAPSGLAGDRGAARDTGVREGKQPTTLKEPKGEKVAEPKKATEKAERAAKESEPRTAGRGAKGTAETVAKEPPKPSPKAAPAKEAKAPDTDQAAEAVEKGAGNKAWRALAGEPLVDFVEIMTPTYENIAGKKDIATAADVEAVTKLLQTPAPKLNEVAKAAGIYFGKMQRVVDNLLNISFDIVYDTPLFRRTDETDGEAAFFQGMSGANALKAREWVSKNLSNDAKLKLEQFIVSEQARKDAFTDAQMEQLISMATPQMDITTLQYVYGDKAAERVQSYLNQGMSESEAIDKVIQENIKNEGKTKNLELFAVLNLGYSLHPAVRGMIADGNLVGALRLVSTQLDGTMSNAARKLAANIGETKVEVVKDLKDDAGNPVPGLYDPKTDTIKLDAESGMVPHVLLHEATHAATSHVLDNKSHPVTKQLTQLYNDVKESLDTAYGAQDLDEFVAESFSNPEFQSKLDAINPKGEKITAWQRFANTITNFVRRMMGLGTKPIESAQDRADRLINSILSPAPTNRDAGMLYAASLAHDGDTVLDRLTERIQSMPGMTQERVAAFHEFFSGSVPNNLKNFLRSVLPLNALVDIAEKYIPMAKRLDDLVGERSGAESRRNTMIEPILKRVETWAKDNADKIDTFNDVVYNSTLDQVDPSKPRSTYEKDADKLKVWDSLQSDWRKLGADGQSVYKQMRDTYDALYKEIKRVIDQRIDDSLADKETAKKVKTEIYQRLFASGNIEPYFPLTRTGKYWLSYHATDPRTKTKELFVEAFETQYERDQTIKRLREVGAEEIQKFANLSDIGYKKAPPTSFVNSVLKTMEVNKVDGDTIEEVMRLFLNALPETSFAQSFRRRKGVPGFKRDAVGALRMKTFSLSRQLANMEYGNKLEKLRSDMRDYVAEKGNDEVTVGYLDELEKRIDFAVNPEVPQWSKLATSFGFNMTLGFNISSALVNLSQIPLVVMPYLGGKYGYAETTKAIGRATRIFTSSGFEREVEMLVPTDKGEKKAKVRAFPSLDNIDFDKNPALRHLKTLSDLAGERGQLNRSITYDVLDVDDSTNLLTKVNAASGFVFHHGERMNRQVALIAAYELELARLKKAGKTGKAAEQEAANYAIYVTELTNGGTVAAAAPRIAQSGLGKVLFMFKRYGVSMYYMLFKTARDALKSEDPEVRKQAKKQIAGIYASSALLAGVQGIPLFGVAAMVYNMFADDDEDDFNTAARKWMGELLYSGVGNNVLGIEVASRMGLSDLIFRDNTVKDQQSVILSTMEMLGGPVLGVMSRMERGLSLINEGNVERGIEQMLPSAIGNGLKSIRFGTEGAQTLRGDPIVGEFGPWNVFAQGIGFAPAEYTRQLEINSRVKKIDRTANETRTKLLRRYYSALRMGDGQEMSSTMQDIMKFNKKHPSAVITADTIKRSMAQHGKTSATMYHGITISRNMRPEILANIAEYDDGWDADEYDEE